VVHWPSKFVANPTEPHHKPLDESIQQKVMSEEWATCFLAYLVALYREGNGWRKLPAPSKVMAYTNDYQEDSDAIARFIREYVMPLPAGEVGDHVTTGMIYAEFQQWKRTNEVSKGSTGELKKRLEGIYGAHPRNGWTSFRFGSS
jgi:phage/plasmid-associated DNA primase